MDGTHSATKPALKGSTCLCRACGEYFARLADFDAHRTGPYSERLCTTPEQMHAKQWNREAGLWSQPESR